jgi:hypothetical protein
MLRPGRRVEDWNDSGETVIIVSKTILAQNEPGAKSQYHILLGSRLDLDADWSKPS